MCVCVRPLQLGPQRARRSPCAVSGDCAGHCGESRAPSGDNAAAPSAVSLRREPGPQRRQRAPQPLLQSLETAPATAERAGPPAATTRAAAPSAVSGDCAGHCGESRAPSGDNARRSPFSSLSKLRRPLRRQPGPQAATTRAAIPSAISGDYAGFLWREPGF